MSHSRRRPDMPPIAPSLLAKKRKSLSQVDGHATKKAKGDRRPLTSVANDFVALPFQLGDTVHNVYARHQEPSEDEDWPEGQSLFVASLPIGSTSDDIETAFTSLTSSSISSIQIISTGRIGEEQRRTLLDTEGLHGAEEPTAVIHPLFTSSSTSSDLAALRPQHAAVIIFSSSAGVTAALRPPPTLTPWPTSSLSSFSDLHARMRPSLSDVRKHTDEWMAAFEKREAIAAALPPVEPSPAQPAMAIDDDESDGGGWTLVKRGGTHGRSLLPTEPGAQKDTAFATGLPSVHVASRTFERKAKLGRQGDVQVDPRVEKKRRKQAELMEGFYGFKKAEQRAKRAFRPSLCLDGRY